jgi:hypothetical protein
MDDALFGSLIESADGLHEGSLRIGGAFVDIGAGGADGNTSFTTVNAVAQTLLVVLAVTLDLRLDVSHYIPPKINTISQRIILQHGGKSVQTEM